MNKSDKSLSKGNLNTNSARELAPIEKIQQDQPDNVMITAVEDADESFQKKVQEKEN